jgi:uncharacterized protein (TIGR00304 family)
MEQLITLGVIVVFIGFALIIIGSFLEAGGKGEAKVAVGGFIGPIPFGFANDRQMLYIVITIAMIMFVVSVLLLLGQKSM